MKTDEIIIPTADEIITPVLEKLYEKRPNSFQHANLRSGVYWHPVLGYRAQAALMIRRLSQLAAARRLASAEGQELADYVASEFGPLPNTDPTFAVGTVTLGRVSGSPLPGGRYPKGTKLTRAAFEFGGLDFPAAEFETLVDARIDAASTSNITIPVRATRAGPHANTPSLAFTTVQTGMSVPNLVSNMEVKAFESAGGSNKLDDDFLRLFAKVYAVGQYGPTASASKMAALLATGVRHFMVYDTPATGAHTVLIADESWGTSSALASTVQQSMYDNDLVGFGCKVSVGVLQSVVVTVSAAVSLRDRGYLANTVDIDDAIGLAVRNYFDTRPDFTWTSVGLKNAISRAHPKIFACTGASVYLVRDATSNSLITETTLSSYKLHYLLATKRVTTTYSGPV